jgi:hypothetical protein
VAKHQHIEKVEPLVPQVQAETSQTTGTSNNPPPKVDFATDLFDMLSMDDPNEKSSNAADASADDDNNWAGFQCMFSVYFLKMQLDDNLPILLLEFNLFVLVISNIII